MPRVHHAFPCARRIAELEEKLDDAAKGLEDLDEQNDRLKQEKDQAKAKLADALHRAELLQASRPLAGGRGAVQRDRARGSLMLLSPARLQPAACSLPVLQLSAGIRLRGLACIQVAPAHAVGSARSCAR